MRKIIIALISIGLMISCVPDTSVYALGNDEKKVRDSMEIDGYVVSFSFAGDEVVYDIDSGSIAINNEIKGYIITTVSDFDSNIFTEEELLEMDKQYTVEQFENYLVATNTQAQSVSDDEILQRSYEVSIPSNAPYVSAGTFRKEISELAGEISAGLAILAEIINNFSTIPVIPHAALLTATSIALNISSALLDDYRGSITAVWTYQMHRTKITYTVGITKQYGYRYANNGVDYEVEANGKTVDVRNSNNSYGGWWVTQKPF